MFFKAIFDQVVIGITIPQGVFHPADVTPFICWDDFLENAKEAQDQNEEPTEPDEDILEQEEDEEQDQSEEDENGSPGSIRWPKATRV